MTRHQPADSRRVHSGRLGMRLAMIVPVLVGPLLAGCSSSGPAKFGQGSGATPGLSQSNFRIVKSNVRGDSYGFKFLGFIPIVPARLADAKEDLYQKLDKGGVRLEGRSIALANATEDENHYYFIIGSVPRITLTADIIEFLDERTSAPKTSERQRESEPMTGALMPSSILKPSALNTPVPSTPAPTPSSKSAPATAPVSRPNPPTQSPPASELAPIGTDSPIAEFDIPPFTTQGKETGTVPTR